MGENFRFPKCLCWGKQILHVISVANEVVEDAFSFRRERMGLVLHWILRKFMIELVETFWIRLWIGRALE